MKNILFSGFTKTRIFALACVLLIGCDTAPKSHTAKAAPKAKESKTTTPSVATPEVATTSPASAPATAPTASTGNNAADVQALKDGVFQYNNGDYNAAIKLLTSPAIVSSKNKVVKLDAFKYAAFSYCVTSKAQQCRQQFDRAFKLDPNFDLSPAEIGHPIWGPEFSRVKNTQKKQPATKGKPN
jgi:hypothetical protein